VKENCAFTYLNQIIIIIQYNVMYLPMYISFHLYWSNDNEISSILAHLLHKNIYIRRKINEHKAKGTEKARAEIVLLL
jgi:hypothetical protein